MNRSGEGEGIIPTAHVLSWTWKVNCLISPQTTAADAGALPVV